MRSTSPPVDTRGEVPTAPHPALPRQWYATQVGGLAIQSDRTDFADWTIPVADHSHPSGVVSPVVVAEEVVDPILDDEVVISTFDTEVGEYRVARIRFSLPSD